MLRRATVAGATSFRVLRPPLSSGLLAASLSTLSSRSTARLPPSLSSSTPTALSLRRRCLALGDARLYASLAEPSAPDDDLPTRPSSSPSPVLRELRRVEQMRSRVSLQPIANTKTQIVGQYPDLKDLLDMYVHRRHQTPDDSVLEPEQKFEFTVRQFHEYLHHGYAQRMKSHDKLEIPGDLLELFRGLAARQWTINASKALVVRFLLHHGVLKDLKDIGPDNAEYTTFSHLLDRRLRCGLTPDVYTTVDWAAPVAVEQDASDQSALISEAANTLIREWQKAQLAQQAEDKHIAREQSRLADARRTFEAEEEALLYAAKLAAAMTAKGGAQMVRWEAGEESLRKLKERAAKKEEAARQAEEAKARLREEALEKERAEAEKWREMEARAKEVGRQAKAKAEEKKEAARTKEERAKAREERRANETPAEAERRAKRAAYARAYRRKKDEEKEADRKAKEEKRRVREETERERREARAKEREEAEARKVEKAEKAREAALQAETKKREKEEAEKAKAARAKEREERRARETPEQTAARLARAAYIKAWKARQTPEVKEMRRLVREAKAKGEVPARAGATAKAATNPASASIPKPTELRAYGVALGKPVSPSFKEILDGTADWYASRKLDGVRCIAYLDFVVPDDGTEPQLVETSFYSRTGNAFTSLSNLDAQMRLSIVGYPGLRELVTRDEAVINTDGLRRLVLDGEVCVMRPLTSAERAAGSTHPNADGATHGVAGPLWEDDGLTEDFNATVSQVRRKRKTVEYPAYYMFDLLHWSEFVAHGPSPAPGLGLTFSQRQADVQALGAYLSRDKTQRTLIRPLVQQKVTSRADIESMIERSAREGWEGLVLRKDVPYRGKRCLDVLKYKEWQDAEYTVVGTETSRQHLYVDGVLAEREALASVWIEHKGHRVSVGSGFTTEQRLRYARKPEEIVGKEITVAYFGESEAADREAGVMSLRFPRVKKVWEEGWREV